MDLNLKKLRTALGELKKVSEQADVVEGQALIPEITTSRILGGKPARRLVMEVLDKDKDALRKIAATPRGRDIIDTLVDTTRTELEKDPEMKTTSSVLGKVEIDRFLQEAFKARFGVEKFYASPSEADEKVGLKTKLRRDAMLRYYKVFKEVPATHTTTNESVNTVVDITEFKGGWYEDYGKKIAIQVKKLDEKDKQGVNLFDKTNLHEIGHAVDDKYRYMAQNGSSPDHGGWRRESITSIRQVMIDKARARLGDVPVATIVKYCDKVSQKEVPAAADYTSPPVTAAQVAALKAEAFDWFRKIKNSGRQWVDAQALAVGGRVYIESYKNQWWSYDATSLGMKSSDYQYRAPGEWFAEAYAYYFLKGGLPGGNGLAKFLDEENWDMSE